jgi:hypothetical protein
MNGGKELSLTISNGRLAKLFTLEDLGKIIDTKDKITRYYSLMRCRSREEDYEQYFILQQTVHAQNWGHNSESLGVHRH